MLLWKYCHSHSFSRVNFQACALIFRSPPFPIRRSNQGTYLMVTLFASAILNFLEINTAMDANFFLPSLLLVLSLLGTSFAKCPPSEYNAPNGTVNHTGFTDDNNLTCTFNIRVPVGLRAVLEIKKLREQLQNTPQLIYMSLNNNSVYCVMPRSSKLPDTCK